MFDRVLLLYEGRQIFFGSTDEAKNYFLALGFICPDRSTTADYLTSLTNPRERIVRVENQLRAPRTPDQFAEVWKKSPDRTVLLQEIQAYENGYPSRKQQDSDSTRRPHKSPYLITLARQIQICLVRNFQGLRNEPTATISAIVGNVVISIILGSMFYNLPESTDSFFGRGVLIFFMTLLNATMGSLEVCSPA